MSGLEVLAVVAAVAAVVSAFNDGNRIVARIKQKRREKNALPPTMYLEESLQSGPPAIEAERDNGMRVFGQVFAQGDAIAIDSLQKIIIELQGTLLTHLHRAQEDDSFIEFNPVIEASDLGRVKAVSSLCELYMRLAAAAPIRPATTNIPQAANSQQMPRIEGLGTYGSPLQFKTPNKLPASITRSNGRHDVPRAQTAWDNHNRAGQSAIIGVASHSSPHNTTSSSNTWEPVSSTPDMGSRVWTMPDALPETLSKSGISTTYKDDHKKRKPSIFEMFRRGSSKDEKTQPAIESVVANRHSHGSHSSGSHSWDHPLEHPEDSCVASRLDETSSATERKPSDSDNAMLLELNENVWDDSHNTKDAEVVTVYEPIQQKITPHPTSNLEVYESAPELRHSTSPSPAPIRLSHTISDPLPALVIPSSENNYGGFCKSAWKLQVGERDGIKVRKEMGPATSMIHVWGCANKKCAFQMKIFGDLKHPTFDPRVHQSSSAIRFRWSFLVKSHVVQPRVVNGSYSYKCILCCSKGSSTPVFGGIDTLLGHLEIHRDKPVPAVLLHNAGCIMDRFAPDDEDFDLNIVPSTHGVDPD